MRVVVALCGNALLPRHERPGAVLQRHHVRAAAEALAPLAEEHQLLVCHASGPLTGLPPPGSDADPASLPLDALGAQSQGVIGYWLAQELCNAGVAQPVVAVLTQTVVDVADPAFAVPSTPVGAVYSRADAERLSASRGWRVAADGTGWRRVVAAPEPRRVVEEGAIRLLMEAGALVVCGGGGGVPVVQDLLGRSTAVEAVVDDGLTAARIAVAMGADWLVLLTDVPGVVRDVGTPHATALQVLPVADVAGLHLPAGSLGPQVRACARFTGATGHPSSIGALADAAAVLAGTAGTTLTPGPPGGAWSGAPAAA